MKASCRKIVNVVVAEEVKMVVWSSLPDTNAFSRAPSTDLEHDEARARVANHLRQRKPEEMVAADLQSVDRGKCEGMGLQSSNGAARLRAALKGDFDHVVTTFLLSPNRGRLAAYIYDLSGCSLHLESALA